jgi:hypothetical protein
MVRIGVLVAVLASLPVAASHAGFVTYSFTGTVTLVSQPAPYSLPVFTGSSVSGSFSYDLASPDLSPSPDYGRYDGASPPGFGVDFTTANAFATAGFVVAVTLDPIAPFHELEVFTSTGVAVDGLVQPSAELYLRFRDSTATAFGSDSLPPPTLTIADFDSATGLLRDVSTGAIIEFRIDSLSGVPSPGAIVAMGFGGVFGGGFRRRRSVAG